MLDERQRQLATATLQQLQQPVELHVDPGPDPDDPFSVGLCGIADELGELAPEGRLQLVRTETIASGETPSLRIGNVRYLAVPVELEFKPFLDLLVLCSNPPPAADPLKTMPPAEVTVLIAPTCPNCPKVVAACSDVAIGLPQLSLSIIDVQVFPELAGTCRSVPTVIVDGARTVVGPLSAAELTEILLQREAADYFQEALASMIEAGRLDELAALLTSEQGLATLPSLLKEGTLQQRMGLMLAIEHALEQDPHALNGAVAHLLPLVETGDATVRGDTADILGQIGAPGAREALTRLLDDENPDVREMAAEALAMLREPS